MTIYTSKGTRTVVTNEQSGMYSSRLYVNCSGKTLGDATLLSAKHTTEKGARKWAEKRVAA